MTIREESHIVEGPGIAEGLVEKFLSDRETLEKYKSVIDSAFYGIALNNRRGEIIYANHYYLHMVGVDSISDISGHQWEKIISGSDRERVKGGWTRLLTNSVEKFWGVVEYQNLKTKEIFKKKVICSRIKNNGYGVHIMPVEFEVPAEFGEEVLG